MCGECAVSVRVQCGVYVLLCPVSLREGRDVRWVLGAVHSAISDVSCVLYVVCCVPCVVHHVLSGVQCAVCTRWGACPADTRTP